MYASTDIDKADLLNKTFAEYCSIPADFPVSKQSTDTDITNANKVQHAVKFSTDGAIFTHQLGQSTFPQMEPMVYDLDQYLQQTPTSFKFPQDMDFMNAPFSIYEIQNVRLSTKYQ